MPTLEKKNTKPPSTSPMPPIDTGSMDRKITIGMKRKK
jgi:hypothetical protein